jgi:hypothetical protein
MGWGSGASALSDRHGHANEDPHARPHSYADSHAGAATGYPPRDAADALRRVGLAPTSKPVQARRRVLGVSLICLW